MKPFTKITSVLFGIMALIHLFRLISPFRVTIGGNEIPVSASFVVIILGIAFSYGLWKESKK